MDRELQEKFESAAKYLPGLSSKLSSDTLLYFYARYKQANIGPCNTDKPGFFDFQGNLRAFLVDFSHLDFEDLISFGPY